jgi:REP element-mobilizing transposase RayT
VDRQRNVPGTTYEAPDPERWAREVRRLRQPPVALDPVAALVVDGAIRQACRRRGWLLRALNVRTNHVHSVVAAPCRPEEILRTFKACGSAALHSSGALPAGAVVWARHGSTRYLWSEAAVEAACAYVMERQGQDVAAHDESESDGPAG